MLELKNIYKTFNAGTINEKSVFEGLSLTLNDGDFVTVIGGNGAGKSTMLNVISGAYPVDDGKVIIDGKDVTRLPEHKRAQYIGRVFQDPRLGTASDMWVEENMSIADSRGHKRGIRWAIRGKDRAKYRELLGMLDLGLEDRLTTKMGLLSGGQRQRVAIGRAMVRDSKVFLMDEPLSNLDAKLRNQMRAEIILLRQKIDTTFIYVTHDRIVIMKDGFIQQVGTPTEVFDMPLNLFVAEFIGAPKMNTFKSELVCEHGKYFVKPYGAKIEVTGNKSFMLAEKQVAAGEIILGVRPEHFKLTDANDPAAIACKITVNEMMGSELHLHVTTNGEDKIILRLPTIDLSDEQRASLAYGNKLYFTFASKVVHMFDPQTEESLLF